MKPAATAGMTTRSVTSVGVPLAAGRPDADTDARPPPAFTQPGVLWYSTRLALTLLLLAPRCLTAVETGCFAARSGRERRAPAAALHGE
jgi:hypothetical protein